MEIKQIISAFNMVKRVHTTLMNW